MLGEKLRELLEAKVLVQHVVAAKLEVNTSHIRIIESDEKPVSRQHLKKLAELFQISERDLTALWLTDKILKIIVNNIKEDKEQALKLALNSIK